MRISNRNVSPHNDNFHLTSAKRGGASGVAPLDAGSKVPIANLPADVASGIAALDASGNVIAPGPGLWLTRDGSNVIGIYERTSNEVVMRFKRTGTYAYNQIVERGNADVLMAALDTNGDIPHMRPKAASANLRHSNDATINSYASVYTKHKTDTFANGISGTLRISFSLSTENAGMTAYGRVYKNGVAIGTEQSTVTVFPSGETKTEDINVGVLAPGDTIELWAHGDGSYRVYVSNFRISYDNAADTVPVAGFTAS